MPRIETFRKDNEYIVRLDLPGLIPRTFRSTRKEMFYRFPGDERQRRRGRIINNFAQGVETEKITARAEHGVLEIRVPLPAQLTGRKIPVQIEQKENKKLDSKAA